MIRGIFGPGTLVLGGGAALLIAFLAVGFFLPGSWAATAEATIPVSADSLGPYLDSPEGWQAWTPWPDSLSPGPGPRRGAGSSMTWSDPDLGSGIFRIEAVNADGGVRYSVEVEGVGGDVMRTDGSLFLTPRGDSTHVVWREEGDLGANPLMGFWALSMERAQGTEMRKSLDRLAEVAAGGQVTSVPEPTR
ncbi:MAG: SRPBCC family protein [Longimicrobiales bacterium]|nr:SRPBCC family protein [Longimicrobiales bacterium]